MYYSQLKNIESHTQCDLNCSEWRKSPGSGNGPKLSCCQGDCGRCHTDFCRSPSGPGAGVKLLQLEYVLLALRRLVHGKKMFFKI